MTQSMSTNSRTHRIVVGVDGSESSKDAMRWAVRMAPLLGCTIDAVTAWQYELGAYGYAAMAPTYRPEDDARHMQEVVLKEAFGDVLPDGLRALVVEGHPAEVLVERSAGAQLLVVGSRGHGGFVGLLIGSVSAHCAEHARCPVTVVHHSEVEPA